MQSSSQTFRWKQKFHLWWLMGTSCLKSWTSVIWKFTLYGAEHYRGKQGWKEWSFMRRILNIFSFLGDADYSVLCIQSHKQTLQDQRCSQFSRFFFVTEASLWIGAQCLISSHDSRSSNLYGNANQPVNKILANSLIYNHYNLNCGFS